MFYIVLLLLALVAPNAFSHPGFQDACGGHRDAQAGNYHVHNMERMEACVSRREATAGMIEYRYLPWVPEGWRDSSLNWTIEDHWVRAYVLRVIDGDTIEIRIPESRDDAESVTTVRLIGIDTPETRDPGRGPACYGTEASSATRALLVGREVYLEFDVEPEDRFGRLLAYVYLPDGTFVNARLVEMGYARELHYEPNVKHYSTLFLLQELARLQGLGQWGWCTVSP